MPNKIEIDRQDGTELCFDVKTTEVHVYYVPVVHLGSMMERVDVVIVDNLTGERWALRDGENMYLPDSCETIEHRNLEKDLD